VSIARKLPFKIKPYQWQFDAIVKTEELPEYALFAEVGAGKTCAMVNILRTKYYQHGRVLKTLIISPLVTLYNWRDEIMMHSNIKDSTIVVLDKAANRYKQTVKALYDEREAKFSRDKIVVVNYEAVLSEKFYDLISDWQPELIVLDEMHYIKNHKSKRGKKIIKLGDKALYRFGLTGTPMLNSPMDLFNQFRFLDKGMTFGKNFFTFRAQYFQDSNAGWAGKKGHFPKFEAIPEKFGELTTKIYRKAVRVTKEQCLDLPPLIKKKVYATLSKDQMRAYKEMKDQFITFVNDSKDRPRAVVAQIALTKALRLQQIVCGHVTDDDGNTHVFKEIPRLEAAKQLLEELTPNHKVIVWCSFKKDYELIEGICKELKVEYGFITGDQTLKQKQESMDRLKQDPLCRVIIANRRAGGIGINLIEAQYSIVYSRNFSLGEEIQSEARNYRGGSQIHERVVKLDLVSKDTIDETVLEALRNKQDISDKIIDLKF
jgi:SWI/SNF-related matrix-associated actin-dependent regulator 1 of chromatin subfamily A